MIQDGVNNKEVRAKRSYVWDYFILKDDGKSVTCCVGLKCKVDIPYTDGSTTLMIRHLEKSHYMFHGMVRKDLDPEESKQPKISTTVVNTTKKSKQEQINKALIYWISIDNQAFYVVENIAFKNLFKILTNGNFKLPHRTTFKNIFT